MELNTAIRWVDSALATRVGHPLREPELVILKGTWRGLTYEQMAEGSEYSINYLMRDVAPKLWKQLSNLFNRSVGKTNFRIVLEAYIAANASNAELAALGVQEVAASTPSESSVSDGLAARLSPQEGQVISSSLSSALSLYGGGFDLVTVHAAIPDQLYGYCDELSQVTPWLREAIENQEGCCLGIWGLQGIGKTLLTQTLVHRTENHFEFVIWRSLLTQPSLEALCTSVLSSLGLLPEQPVAQLLNLMTHRSLLLVLEGAEAILQPQSLAGEYLSAYQGYREFFQSVLASRSCVVITGIEAPAELIHQERLARGGRIKSLRLQGLSESAASELLEAEGLSKTPHFLELIERYQGHPLALKAAARVIREIFNGQVAAFLSQSSLLFAEVLRLLAPSFERLSAEEISIVYWLASQEGALSLEALQQTLPLAMGPAQLVSALDSLKQRSLLEIDTRSSPPSFCLPGLVRAYSIHQFAEHFSAKQSSYPLSEPVINLSRAAAAAPVRLSQWFECRFEADWQPLDRLFESSVRPAMRLRSAYHLRDETFIKRCKSIRLGQVCLESASTADKKARSQPDSTLGEAGEPSSVQVILLVAIHEESNGLYKICVQAQPSAEASVLPGGLSLKLLDPQANPLAAVKAEAQDSFIQLPYFRGTSEESFEIELALGRLLHREAFML